LNGDCGLYIEGAADAQFLSITDNICVNNGQDTVCYSIGLYADVENSVLTGNICTDDQGTQTQQYGLQIGMRPGNVISSGNLSGNGTAGYNRTTGYGEVVRDVPGFNPVGALGPPAVPASTVACPNPYVVDCDVYITGGDVTVIEIDGVATGLITGSFFVKAGSSITITYNPGAPTWVWYGR
jgi:hypothetical protein